MKSMTTTEIQKNFGGLVAQAIREPVSITKHMKEVFVIVPADEFHAMKQLASVQKRQRKKNTTLTDFLGAGRRFSRFASVEAVDEYLAAQRDIWEI